MSVLRIENKTENCLHTESKSGLIGGMQYQWQKSTNLFPLIENEEHGKSHSILMVDAATSHEQTAL